MSEHEERWHQLLDESEVERFETTHVERWLPAELSGHDEVPSRAAMFSGVRIEKVSADLKELKIESLSGLPFEEVRVEGGHEPEWSDDRQSITINLEGKACLLLTFGRDRLVLAHDGALSAGLVSLKQPVTSVLRYTLEVLDWSEALDDPWLKKELKARFEGGETEGWEVAVAVGMFGRLSRVPPLGIQRLAERMVMGERLLRHSAPDGWSKSLHPPQKAELVQSFAIACDMLLEALEELDEIVDPDDPYWRSQVLRQLHHRSELASAMLVLHRAGCSDEVESLLEHVDYVGRAWIGILPMLLELSDDELLLREYEFEPEVWWTQPVTDARMLSSMRSGIATQPVVDARRLSSMRSGTAAVARLPAPAQEVRFAAAEEGPTFMADTWEWVGERLVWIAEMSVPEEGAKSEGFELSLCLYELPDGATEVALYGLRRPLKAEGGCCTVEFTLGELRVAEGNLEKEHPVLILELADGSVDVGLKK